MIEKLVKEFEKIRASLNKSKKLILADIDKIDEKYRRLAQEEKKSLTESLGVLNDQLKYYDSMLGDAAETTEEATAEEQKTEEEPVIQDTIFPENNEPEEQEREPDKKEEPEVQKTDESDKKEEKKQATEIPSDGIAEVESHADATVEQAIPQSEPVASTSSAIEDLPEVTDADWADAPNGEQKLDENGWPVW